MAPGGLQGRTITVPSCCRAVVLPTGVGFGAVSTAQQLVTVTRPHRPGDSVHCDPTRVTPVIVSDSAACFSPPAYRRTLC